MVSVYTEDERRIIAEAQAEALASDPVVQAIIYKRFVSRSKGRRNGKQRIRRHWREVHLVNYRTGFMSWHRAPFDDWATEIMGSHADGEVLKERISQLWGY